MDNHFHLVVRTPDANLSEAMRWLQVSYSSTFNWAHRIRGHVFQGRYRSVLIEDWRGVVEVARYVHLNPVRIRGLGLGKAEQRRARVADIADPGAELVKQRLRVLGEYPWSSWRVYGGAERRPGWLATEVVGSGCGGRTVSARRAALREYTEAPVRQGRMESPWDRVVGGLVLGTAEFAATVLARGDTEVGEPPRAAWRPWAARPEWAEIVGMAEQVSGRVWSEAVEAHGSWLRDAVLYTAVRHLGHRLADVYRGIPGLNYPAAAKGVKRFERMLEGDSERQRFVRRLRGGLKKGKESPS